jgi:hypothetical protein
MTPDEMIDVIQGYKDGKEIEYRPETVEDWYDCGGRPNWDFYASEYRIKPEPREWYMRIYNNNVISPSLYDTQKQAINAFSAAGHNFSVIKVREVL